MTTLQFLCNAFFTFGIFYMGYGLGKDVAKQRKDNEQPQS